MYFITIKRMLEVCFSAHPNIQYRAIYKSSCLIREVIFKRISKCTELIK